MLIAGDKEQESGTVSVRARKEGDKGSMAVDEFIALVLKEVAEKRLEAIKEFTDLGSGFKIAMRDLEIRGAGSLLGRSQHGPL